MSTDEPLMVTVEGGGVARIVLNRPQQRNALDGAQWDRLGEALVRLAQDRTVRCLVITGRERAFASGGDLTTLLQELDEEGGAARFRKRIARCLGGLSRFPWPTIARLNGPAIGGGLELAIACDLRIAARGVKFGMPAARFGMVMARADFSRLASIVGIDRARFLAITADVIDGDEALRIGLVHQLVDEAKLDETTDSWISKLCAMEPGAVAWFRRAALLLERCEDLSSLAAFEEKCLMQPEFRQRVEAFLKR